MPMISRSQFLLAALLFSFLAHADTDSAADNSSDWSTAFDWRTQGVEESSGSGTDRNGSEILTTGPIAGLIYKF